MKIVYKCQLCETAFQQEGSPSVLEKYAAERLVRLTKNGYDYTDTVVVSYTVIHECKDGSFGIAVALGARKEVSQ